MKICSLIDARSKEEDCLALKQVGSISLIRKLVYAIKSSGVDDVYVVVGESSEDIALDLNKSDAIILYDENYKKHSEFESELKAIERFYKNYDYLLYTSVRSNTYNMDTIKQVIDKEKYAIAYYNNMQGNLALLPLKEFENINRNNNFLIESYQRLNGDWLFINVNDKGILKNQMDSIIIKPVQRPLIKVTIAKDEKFFGPGIARLLELIEDTGSVKSAVNSMNLSYSKAWKMINIMESELDFQVVERKPGGSGGGESKLTKEGKDFLEKYLLLSKLVTDYSKEKFEEIFKE